MNLPNIFQTSPIKITSITTKNDNSRRQGNRFNVVFSLDGISIGATDASFLVSGLSDELIEFIKSCIKEGVHPDGGELPHKDKYKAFRPFSGIFDFEEKEKYISIEREAVAGKKFNKTIKAAIKAVDARIKEKQAALTRYTSGPDKNRWKAQNTSKALRELQNMRLLLKQEERKKSERIAQFIRNVRSNYRYLGRTYIPRRSGVGDTSGLLVENIKRSPVNIKERNGKIPTNVRVVISVPKKRARTVQAWKLFGSSAERRGMNEHLRNAMSTMMVTRNRSEMSMILYKISRMMMKKALRAFLSAGGI